MTAASINVDNNIQLGTAGIVTAITFVGNVTGNVNATSNLLLQTGGTERLRIASDGTLTYRTGGGKGYDFNSSGSSAGIANMFCPASYTIAFGTNNNERLRIDSSGRLFVGTSNPINTSSSKFQVAANDASGSVVFARFSASTYSSYLNFYKSRSNTLGTAYVVNDDDHLGTIRYYGADGSNSGYTTAAEIYGSCDGGSGAAGDMPGRITFHTRPDGAGQSMQERLRIDSSGRVMIGSGAYIGGAALAVIGSSTTPNTYGC